jgi:hypothetical protein
MMRKTGHSWPIGRSKMKIAVSARSVRAPMSGPVAVVVCPARRER